jgi:hypothetical protein
VVVPDVDVEHDGNEWKIHLNNDYIPRLRISSTYRDLIAKGSLSKGERDYLKDRMRSGKFLIDSIEQRQRTIERITREILKAQMPFFEHGVSQLKPLTMTQIADVVGVHETTVSRAIANKYIRTPHGVFEFKYFFTPGYQNDNGASVSNTSVKEMIADLVAARTRAAPSATRSSSTKLQEKGINIARRTVAKYREELGDPARATCAATTSRRPGSTRGRCREARRRRPRRPRRRTRPWRRCRPVWRGSAARKRAPAVRASDSISGAGARLLATPPESPRLLKGAPGRAPATPCRGGRPTTAAW